MSDEKWFDALAGREAADASSIDLLEARLLRASLRKEAASLADHEAKLEATVAPLKRIRCAGCAHRTQRLIDWLLTGGPSPAHAGALVALLLTFMVVPWWLFHPQDTPTPSLRGGGIEQVNGVCLLKSGNPAEARDDMARRLAATGAQISSYERIGRKGLQAYWPGEIPVEAHADLAACRFSTRSDRPLIVEFSLPTP